MGEFELISAIEAKEKTEQNIELDMATHFDIAILHINRKIQEAIAVNKMFIEIGQEYYSSKVENALHSKGFEVSLHDFTSGSGNNSQKISEMVIKWDRAKTEEEKRSLWSMIPGIR